MQVNKRPDVLCARVRKYVSFAQLKESPVGIHPLVSCHEYSFQATNASREVLADLEWQAYQAAQRVQKKE